MSMHNSTHLLMMTDFLLKEEVEPVNDTEYLRGLDDHDTDVPTQHKTTISKSVTAVAKGWWSGGAREGGCSGSYLR